MVGEKTMAELSREVMALKTPQEYRAYAENLLEKFNSGSKSSGAGTEMMMMAQKSRPGPARGIARASELSSPAPSNHLLREYGQSDRQLVGNETKEANMAQVLEVMNGHVEKMVVLGCLTLWQCRFKGLLRQTHRLIKFDVQRGLLILSIFGV